jgi:hypothetical protein
MQIHNAAAIEAVFLVALSIGHKVQTMLQYVKKK